MSKISVIMPVYNTEEIFLREAIESILNQTYTDFEFIILDDNSEINIRKIILSYSDKRIKYFKNDKNFGLSKTLNRAFDLATGEFIARMDSDDISLPLRFEEQIYFLENHKEISILGTWFETFPQKDVIKNLENPRFLDFLNACQLGHPTVMYRKNDFDKYKLRYNEDYTTAEDYELWSRAVRVLNIANLQKVLLKYRIHKNNFSTVKYKLLKKLDFEIRQNMLKFLTSNKKLQQKIAINSYDMYLKSTFLQQIFSIKNESIYKSLRIFGINFRFFKKS